MSVFTRISDIINSNLSAALDQAEDPEKVIRLLINDMQESLVQLRAATAAKIADKKQLKLKLKQLNRKIAHWQEKTELAISHGRDDLAKAALQQRNQLETPVIQTEADLIYLNDNDEKLKQDTGTLEDKLKNARTRQQGLNLRAQTAKSRIKLKRQLEHISTSGAFSKFDDYERKLELMEGEVESYDLGRVDFNNVDLTSELDRLEQDETLNRELENLKARMSVKTPSPLITHQA